MFWFSLQLLSETFLILRRTERDMIKKYVGIHVKYPLFLSDFNEASILSTDFGKILNIKFHENPSSRSRAFPCGRTDGQTDRHTHDEANSRFSQFCERALKQYCSANYLPVVFNEVILRDCVEIKRRCSLLVTEVI